MKSGSILKTTVAAVALCIALSYTFGYDYLFTAVRQTYLRGETAATIRDGAYFSANAIKAGKPAPWGKAPDFNKKKLPPSLLNNLKATKTAAFLIIQNGQLLHEEYWEGNQKTRTNSFSMAKTLTVMLAGKAIEEGKLKSLDQKFSDLFPEYKTMPFGKNLTLKNLAQMEASLDWQENSKNPFLPNAAAYYGHNLAQTVLSRGITSEPGTAFRYQSGATQLLGFALKKALNKSLAVYMSEKFWMPMGMEQDAFWNTDDYGTEKTFCCINAEARDYAKIGQMMLAGGRANGTQILDEKFLQVMLTPSAHSRGAYGLATWLNYDAPEKYYFLWGLYGQYIIIIPGKNMVIVRTGNSGDHPKDTKGRPLQVEEIVKAVVANY